MGAVMPGRAYRPGRDSSLLRTTGTGAALEPANRGGIDLAIAHAPSLEKQFIADGWGARTTGVTIARADWFHIARHRT
jgi:ABC-type tungstate transport system permease subunit